MGGYKIWHLIILLWVVTPKGQTIGLSHQCWAASPNKHLPPQPSTVGDAEGVSTIHPQSKRIVVRLLSTAVADVVPLIVIDELGLTSCSYLDVVPASTEVLALNERVFLAGRAAQRRGQFLDHESSVALLTPSWILIAQVPGLAHNEPPVGCDPTRVRP